MKKDRPSFSTYRAHVYRQGFGRSLSLKPIIEKTGERYAVLKTTPYKLFWLLGALAAASLYFVQELRMSLVPLYVLPALYVVVAPIRYFFARFVKLDSDFVSDAMCERASKSDRPSFSVYLRYVFIPRRERLIDLIEEGNGRGYYLLPVPLSNSYPVRITLFIVLNLLFRLGFALGGGFILLTLLIFVGLNLLLSLLSVYCLNFKTTDEPEDTLPEEDKEPSAVSNKVKTGIWIAAGAIFTIILIFIIIIQSQRTEMADMEQPETLAQAYDDALAYTLEQCGNAELVGFYVKFEGSDTLLSGEPSYFCLVFQDAPGLLPEPNTTLSFYSRRSYDYVSVIFQSYQNIRPPVNTGLIDLPTILDILDTDADISIGPDISLVSITATRPSAFFGCTAGMNARLRFTAANRMWRSIS